MENQRFEFAMENLSAEAIVETIMVDIKNDNKYANISRKYIKPKLITAFHFWLNEAYKKCQADIQKLHLSKDNHKIGIELESYCNVLLYRGFNKEHDMLLEVASRLK